MSRPNKAVLLFAAVLAVIAFVVSVSGYGMLTTYGWPIWLFLVLLVFGLRSFRRGEASAFVLNMVVVVVIGIVGMLAGDWTRRAYGFAKCRSCEPMLRRLSAFRSDHGEFPTNLPTLEMPRGIAVSQRRLSGGDLDLDGVNQADATLYLGTNGFVCIVPVTKMLPLSFTRFYAYVRNERDHDWRYDYVVWIPGLREQSLLVPPAGSPNRRERPSRRPAAE